MAERITSTRRIEWDAMHRIPGHQGACRAFHGHRYAAEITCSREMLADDGMVIDFGIVKETVGKWIFDNLDHTGILSKHDNDPAVEHIMKSNAASGRPVYVIDGAPTAENIAKEIAAAARRLLQSHKIAVVKITVWETPNCFATWTSDEAGR